MAAMEIYAIVKLYSDWADNEYDGIEFAVGYDNALKVAMQHTNKHDANYVEMYRLIITNGAVIAWEEISIKFNPEEIKPSNNDSDNLKPDDYIESE